MLKYVIIVGLFALIGLLFYLAVNRKPRSEGAPPPLPRPTPAPAARAEPAFRPWTPPEATSPDVLAPADDADLPPSVAALRAFERVSDNGSIVSLAPDGGRALLLHDGRSLTEYDVATGKALRTWRDVVPAGWLEELTPDSCIALTGPRLFLSWEDEDDGLYKSVLVDLETRKSTVLTDAEDGADAVMSAAVSGDGRFVVTFCNYSKSHQAFDLSLPSRGWFGDFKLEPGTIWPALTVSEDGRYFAVDRGDGDTQVFERADEPDDLSAVEEDDWPDYFEHMSVGGDDRPGIISFGGDGTDLLIVEDDAGLIVVDLDARDFKMLDPFDKESLEDNFRIVGAIWLRGRNQAIAKVLAPDPHFALIDLAEGQIVRTWDAPEGVIAASRLLPTGAGAIFLDKTATIRFFPLLDDAA